MTPVNYANHLKCLDEMIAGQGGADFGTKTKGPGNLLMEHLQQARRGLLGSMQGEYRLSLREALGSVACIVDADFRNKVKRVLESLIAAKN